MKTSPATQKPVDLPPGWKAGYGSFNADSGMDADVFTHEGRKLMVRFSYRDDGFVAYRYAQTKHDLRSFTASNGAWYPLVGTPVMPDALSLIT